MELTPIIAESEFKSAIDADDDFGDSETGEAIILQASAYIFQHTGYKMGTDEAADRLARLCCQLLCADIYYRTQDHKASIDDLLCDLADHSGEEAK